ncbi:MAG TPA: hypothetical protein VMV69_01475 [Pirellulales bacterium]|nr:hypothetical protein [Pirellulales bacterium]
MSDFDSPWKEALEQFFPAFPQFFFPQVHAAIDWSREYEALDKELQQIVRKAAVGRRFVDKRLIDWMMDLPEEMEEQVQEEMVRFGEEKNMPYVTSFERLGFKRGEAEGEAKGKADALLHVLERRFARGVSTDLEAFIRAATDLERLDRWLDLAFEAGSLDEFQRLAQR